jgi:GTP cyclohydrolase I
MIEDQMAILDEPEKEGESDPFEEAIHTLLREVGEDPRREGLIRTPARVARSLRFLTSGYHQDLDKILNGAFFPVAYDEMVIVKDIEIFSICEHHLLPFFGKCHVAYIPNQKVIAHYANCRSSNGKD